MAQLDDRGNLDYSALPFKLPKYRKDNFEDSDELMAALEGGYDTYADNVDRSGVGTEDDNRAGEPPPQTQDRAGTPPPKTVPPPLPPPPPPPPGTGGPPPTNSVPPSPYTGPPASGGGELESLLSSLLSSNRARSDARNQMWGRINPLLDEYSRPVTGQDPNIQRQVSSYQGQTDRAIRNYREFAAERAHAQGIPTGAFESQIGNAINTGGRAVGDLETSLIQDETKNRRASLSDILSQSMGFLSNEENMGLQERMKAIDASLGKMGIDLNAELGRGRLALDKLLGEGQLGVGYAGVGAQNNATNLTNQRFYDEFAYRRSKDAQDRDDRLAELLLGGG